MRFARDAASLLVVVVLSFSGGEGSGWVGEGSSGLVFVVVDLVTKGGLK